MGERHELTDFQNGQIEALSHKKSPAEIGAELIIPRQTIENFLERLQKRGSIENLHRSGKPRKTSLATDRYIVRRALTDTRLPLKDLPVEANADVSIQTIHR